MYSRQPLTHDFWNGRIVLLGLRGVELAFTKDYEAGVFVYAFVEPHGNVSSETDLVVYVMSSV